MACTGGNQAMKRPVEVVVGVFIVVSVLVGAAAAGSVDDNEPTLTKGKFALPINAEDVRADWTARGYSSPKVQPYPRGWSRDEHTHPVGLIMTLVAGRMEFIFGGQRFIVEPGDELFYPANTVHSARNTYDGTTQMMESHK
jgi:mannose-6-phosphate isomerase-like protein (cupin superfamily)